MKYLIVSETYPPEINGVALTVRSMVEWMVKLGHEVILVRPNQGKRESQAVTMDQVTEILVPGIPLPKYSQLRLGFAVSGKFKKIINKYQPAATYIATEGPLGWAALRAAKKNQLPVLTGFHTRFDQYMGHYGLKIAERKVGNYLKHFHNRADGTLVPTKALKNTLERDGYHHVRLLERAVDTHRFSRKHRSDSLRASWNVGESDLAILHVGRLAAEKNLDLGFAAFHAIQQQHPNSRMIMVGDGPARKKMQQAHPDIVFAGMQTGNALAEYYASADMFLFPSLTETFGNVVLEALASGLPTIAYDYGAALDFIENGCNGYLAPRDDEQAFIRHANILANLTCDLPDLHHNAEQSVNHLTPAKVAERLIELFDLNPIEGVAA